MPKYTDKGNIDFRGGEPEPHPQAAGMDKALEARKKRYEQSQPSSLSAIRQAKAIGKSLQRSRDEKRAYGSGVDYAKLGANKPYGGD